MSNERNNILKTLIINDNKIREIPKHLNMLKKIKEIDLRNNSIISLDLDLMKLKSR